MKKTVKVSFRFSLGFPSLESSCLDIDECANRNDNDCNQLCLNTNGSFTCNCSSGYQLNSDGRTCDGNIRANTIF